MRYYLIVKDMSSRFDLRYRMVKLAEKSGISEAARRYGSTRKTVRKWLRRYEGGGYRALGDRSCAPMRIPHKTPYEVEKRVLELRDRYPRWGARRLKEHFDIPCSPGAIHRIIKQNGRVKKRKRKWQRRLDLRAKKLRMRVFEKLQIDTKDLSDIEGYWPSIRSKGLPRYEYTAREMACGALFYAYANTNDSTNAALFLQYIIGHLKRHGIEVERMRVQTDNGPEYVGSVSKKRGISAFEEILKKYRVGHERIPVRCCTWQSDVEAVHRMVEDELYCVESFCDEDELLGKAFTYQLYFNYMRANRWRDGKSPVEILTDRSEIDRKVLKLPPIRLERLMDLCQTGYQVPEPVNLQSFFT